jgi:hypothetical protein
MTLITRSVVAYSYTFMHFVHFIPSVATPYLQTHSIAMVRPCSWDRNIVYHHSGPTRSAQVLEATKIDNRGPYGGLARLVVGGGRVPDDKRDSSTWGGFLFNTNLPR